MTYGTVEHWTLTIKHHDGATVATRLHSWEAATDAFKDAIKANPLSAVVYAVQRRGHGQITTWDYVGSPNSKTSPLALP